MADPKSQWHLRKEVSAINLVTAFTALVGGLWFIMQMKAGIDLLEQRLAASEARIERFEQRTDDSVSELKEEMNDRFDRIERKLDNRE